MSRRNLTFTIAITIAQDAFDGVLIHAQVRRFALAVVPQVIRRRRHPLVRERADPPERGHIAKAGRCHGVSIGRSVANAITRACTAMRFGSIAAMAASNPDRDRRLAGRPRYRFRAANPLADEIQDLLGSETFRRLKRFQKVTDALKSSLGEVILAKLKPVRLQEGVLTIEVLDGPLLAELRQHRERAVLQALAHAGTGVTDVQWRIARSKPPTK